MIVGVTGNSGTGKTLICKSILKNSRYKTVSILDADKIAKELSVAGEEYFEKIVDLFGKEILTEDGILNRKKLASIIFNNPDKKEELDKITYKYVGEETKKRIEQVRYDIVIIDAPLLIESGLNKICNIVISVIADKNIKLDRICSRDNLSKKEADNRLNSQKEDEFYILNSNYVIVNNNLNIERQVKDIIEFLDSSSYNNEIVIIQDEDLKILQFKKLLEYKEIKHCYTLKPLDFGSNITYENKKEEVNSNYKLVCDYLKLDYKNIVRAFQTHTKNVLKVQNENGIFPKELLDVDGLITDKEDKILLLVFADCTPIFLFDKSKSIIANVHSGWKGTLNKILLEALNKMINELSCDPKDIICTIGPTIRKCHFEVEEDIKNEFVLSYKEICNEEEFVEKKNQGKYLIDTVYLNKKIMLSCGISEGNIIDSNICTVCNSNLFHSYRAEKENAGRSTAIICKQ
ncbi:MAG: peptidoglycan editing factor PgeF [Clostridia bacterium]|nr:peptidoglycan editing factor PgeF [Clostridia bacterium]